MPRKKKSEEQPAKEEEVQLPEFAHAILKMTNGDDILCMMSTNLSPFAQTYLIKNPIKVLTMLDPAQADVVHAMVPWIPFTLQPLIRVEKASVAAFTGMSQRMAEMYEARVNAFLDTLKTNDTMVDEGKWVQ